MGATIYAAIRANDKLLLVPSEHAVASDWVEREVELTFERGRLPPETLVLFPIRLDDAVMNTNAAWAGDIRRIRFIGDFREWQNEQVYQRSLQRLLRELHKEERRTSHGKPGSAIRLSETVKTGEGQQRDTYLDDN